MNIREQITSCSIETTYTPSGICCAYINNWPTADCRSLLASPEPNLEIDAAVNKLMGADYINA